MGTLFESCRDVGASPPQGGDAKQTTDLPRERSVGLPEANGPSICLYGACKQLKLVHEAGV